MTTRLARLSLTTCTATLVVACGGGGSSSGTGASSPDPSTPAAALTETLTFGNTGFDQVEIHNSFELIVQYGDRFGVEVITDREYGQVVSVAQDGVRLRIGFDPNYTGDIRAEVARGVVTLPLLSVLDARDSAIVDIAGFRQSYMQLSQLGNSYIEVSNSSIDFVDAALDGSSQLRMTGGSALPAVSVTTAGSSQATFRIMDGGTLTAEASGSSNISYSGEHIAADSRSYGTATITWLGPN